MFRRMCWGPWSLGQNVADDHPRWHAEAGAGEKRPRWQLLFLRPDFGDSLGRICSAVSGQGQDLGLSLEYRLLLISYVGTASLSFSRITSVLHFLGQAQQCLLGEEHWFPPNESWRRGKRLLRQHTPISFARFQTDALRKMLSFEVIARGKGALKSSW